MKDVAAITGDKKIVSMCRTLGDYAAYTVLISVMDSTKSAFEISMENGLPISSTYKAIKKLQHEGLIKSSLADRDGRRIALYKSKIESLKIVVQKNNARIELVNPDAEGNGHSTPSLIGAQ